MYGWIWGHLPGPWPAKLGVSLAGFLAVVVLLFAFVFPWLEPRLPFSGVTVDQSAGALPWHGAGAAGSGP
jgi:hypothetical protein